MKNPTIWESASRPLFVRSVWLETANPGRTLRRHFILDYEPHQREAHLRANNSPARKRRASLKQSNSCDYQDDSIEYLDEYFLLGSTKLTLQQQAQQQQQSQCTSNQCRSPTKSSRQRRRTWLRQCSYYANTRRGQPDLHELYSRRSSLQDLQSTLTNTGSNPEERLAERVLNWLDLAGKNDIVKLTNEQRESHDNPNMGRETASVGQKRSLRNTSTTQESRRNCAKRTPTGHPQGTNATTGQRRKSNASISKQQQQQQQQSANPTCQHNRPDSVKPITIIFNKDGVPMRLNRHARNIDLCAMSSSASTTRRLAGQLASARLYNQTSSPRHIGYIEDKSAMSHANRTLQDAKKQLHIFMPSLPKKGLLMSYPSTEDGASALSNTFSELCQI